jgi:flagellar biosynthesis/type III secretory pathway chaperone
MTMDASQRISDLIVISQGLADLLAMENSALRHGRANEIHALVEQKDELCRAYESRIKGLAEHADAATMATVDPALKDQLRTIGEQVQVASRENAQLLRVAIEVNRRVINEVATAVKASHQASPGTYSKTGGIAGPYRTAAANIPISLNKSL